MQIRRWRREDWSDFLKRGGVLVSMFGGLGNQLFQWSFGQHLTLRNNSDIAYVHVEKTTREQPKKIAICQTSVSGSLYVIQKPVKIPRSLRRVIRLTSMLKEHEKMQVLPHVHAKGLGFEPFYGDKVAGKLVSGYWQSWKYAVGPSGAPFLDSLNLLPDECSAWFQGMTQLAMREAPLMVHRRAADYVGSIFEPPTKEWFGRAMSEALDRLGDRPVWVFSDNLRAAEEIRDLSPGRNARVIRPSPDSFSSESLFLMTLGIGNIISNSTFSWWAAFLSKTSILTIYPSPWFTQLASPTSLTPDHWEPLPR